MLGLYALRWYVSAKAHGVRHNSITISFLYVVTKANPTQATDALIMSADPKTLQIKDVWMYSVTRHN